MQPCSRSSCGAGRRLPEHESLHRHGALRRQAPVTSTKGVASACSSSGREENPTETGKWRKQAGGYRFGSNWFSDLLNDAPRVRMHTESESLQRRKMDQLLEQAVMNAKLSGRTDPWEARQRLEYLKIRRKNWSLVYEYVTKLDVSATLEVIEDAYAKVEATLSAESQEVSSISDLSTRLTELQASVETAREKLTATQARVEMNVRRIEELREEAEALERLRLATAEPQPAEPQPARALGAAAAAGASAAAFAGGGGDVGSALAEQAQQRVQQAQQGVQQAQQDMQQAQQGVQQAQQGVQRARDRGLKSTMETEPALKEFWYPAEFSAALKEDIMVPFDMFGEAWVLFRGADGKAACVADSCAHRACPLSLGTVKDGQVTCAYHGWRFNASGVCTEMPSTVHCKNVGVRSLPVGEKDGFVWVWPGDGEPPAELPDYTRPPEGHVVHAEIFVDVPVEHGLLMENLLDLAHAPFTHTSTFARGWPVPDAVKFHANRLLSGSWDPYPISMSFVPPCMVLSHIGLAQPGKIERGVTADKCKRHLHQLHVCMPAKRGHTRLLYRMALDFMPWVRYVPFIDRVWKSVAGQVLGEDLVLVLGQQDRLERGGDTWSFPVPYDKLAVRYRRWRNSVVGGTVGGETAQTAMPALMTSGEMFECDEDALASFDDSTSEEQQGSSV
ncbi:hypothetical protein FOA52_005633 [Chlamydomonas sp. UWO 241]|nr:hypothetical protein FOA52_005633 [Chlamydomonas sp. UWO 241]QCS40627.1 chloroplast chlorophyllide a oxidase CAO-A [Chlamydomonas sp. UWO 241]